MTKSRKILSSRPNTTDMIKIMEWERKNREQSRIDEYEEEEK